MCRTMNELEKVVADYRGLKAMKEQLDEELKAVEREIIGYLDSNEKLSETGNDFTVKISTCERRTVDTKRLEADLGSLSLMIFFWYWNAKKTKPEILLSADHTNILFTLNLILTLRKILLLSVFREKAPMSLYAKISASH